MEGHCTRDRYGSLYIFHIYSIRSDTSQQIARSEIGQTDSDTKGQNRKDIDDVLSDARQRLGDLDAQLAALSILVERLPKPEVAQKKIATLHELHDLLVLKMATISIFADPDDLSSDPKEAAKQKYVSINNAFDQIQGLLNKLHTYASVSQDLLDSKLKEAKDLRETNKSKSKIADKISVGLYTLGWGLGLAGRLYGGGDVVGAG
jgi:hypothetical protein